MFCKTGMSVIRGLMNEITPFVDHTAGEITDITQQIKDVEGDAMIQKLVSLVPNGSALEAAFNTGLNVITGASNAVETFVDKVNAWLNGSTQLQKEANLVKLAAQTTKALDVTAGNTAASDHVYDAATNLHIMQQKYPDTAAA